MFSFKQLDVLSRLELYSVIYRLKREINCLTTDLLQYENHLNRFQKFFETFSQTNDLNEEILDLSQEIKVLNTMYETQCYIQVNSDVINGINETTEDVIDSIDSEDNTSNKEPNVKSESFSLSDKYKLFQRNMGWITTNDRNSNESNDETIDENYDESDKQFVCKRKGCGKGFLLYTSLKRHLQMHDEMDQNKVFKCDFEGCSKRLRTSFALRSHRNRHNIKYRCDVEGCTFGCTYRSYLVAHALTHSKNKRRKKNENQESITSIEQNSNDSNDVTIDDFIDENVEQNDNQNKQFVCEREGCGKSFLILKSLRQHMIVHDQMDENAVFKCSHEGCEKTFNSSIALIQHKRRHNIKYRCNYDGCGFGSADKCYVRRHVAQVHQKERLQL